MKLDDLSSSAAEQAYAQDDEGPSFSLVDLLTWIGEGKLQIAAVTALAALAALAFAMLLPPIYTARTTLLPPVSQQQGGGASAAFGRRHTILAARSGCETGFSPKRRGPVSD